MSHACDFHDDSSPFPLVKDFPPSPPPRYLFLFFSLSVRRAGLSDGATSSQVLDKPMLIMYVTYTPIKRNASLRDQARGSARLGSVPRRAASIFRNASNFRDPCALFRKRARPENTHLHRDVVAAENSFRSSNRTITYGTFVCASRKSLRDVSPPSSL